MNFLDHREPPKYYEIENNPEYELESLQIQDKQWEFPARYYAAIIFLLALVCFL